jgi:hypothetical protein
MMVIGLVYVLAGLVMTIIRRQQHRARRVRRKTTEVDPAVGQVDKKESGEHKS